MGGGACNLPVGDFTLASVQPGTRLDTQSRSIFSYRNCTADRACWSVEDRQQTILQNVDLSPAKPFDLFRDVRMQSPPPFGPALWSKVLHALLYTNQPRDEHRREHGIGLHRMSDASQKLFHFIEYSVLIADKRQMIVSRKLDKLRTRNPLRHKPSFFNFQTLIV